MSEKKFPITESKKFPSEAQIIAKLQEDVLVTTPKKLFLLVQK